MSPSPLSRGCFGYPSKPSSGLAILLFLLCLVLNVLWCVIAPNGASWATSLGYLASANGLFVVIPASRNSLWAWLLGLPFDQTITIHRWIGRLIVTEATGHFVWYFFEWVAAENLGMLFAFPSYIFGFIAWLALVVIFNVVLRLRVKHTRLWRVLNRHNIWKSKS